MDIELTVSVTGFVLESLTYVGISPLKWNPLTQKAVPITSRWEKLRWYLISVPFTLLQLGIILNFILRKNSSFNPANPVDLWQLIMITVYVETSSFHWRCFRGRNELAILINETHLYFKIFSAEHNKDGSHSWKDKLAPFTTITQLILMMILAFGSVFLFIVRCDSHYAAHFLPIVCNNGVSHYSFGWSTLLGAGHVIFGFYCVSGVFISTAIGSTVILGGINTWDRIKVTTDLEFADSSIQRYRFWSSHYRSWQIILSQVNVFFESLLPTIFCFLMSLHIMLLNGFIMYGQDVVTKCLNLSMQLMITGYYYFIPHMAFKLCDIPKNILESEKENCGNICKLYKSFPHLRIKIGGFDYIHRLTLPTMLQTVFENTINIILLDVS